MSALLRKAEHLATAFHHGQVRKFDGEPYIEHPRRVAELVRRAGGSHHAQAAAWLHDVIEDCGVSAAHLIADHGLPEAVVELVAILSRSSAETHAQFVQRCCHHTDAWLIKRADVLDNLSTLPVGHGMHERYIQALGILHTHQPHRETT